MVNNQNQNQHEQQREITNIQKAVLVERNDSDKKEGHDAGRELYYQVIVSIWMENPVEGLVSVEVVNCEYSICYATGFFDVVFDLFFPVHVQ